MHLVFNNITLSDNILLGTTSRNYVKKVEYVKGTLI